MHNILSELLPENPGIYTGDVVIESSLAGKAQELIARVGLAGKRLLVVCDERTHKAQGARILSELTSATLYIINGTPHADEPAVAALRAQSYDALIAVGSGTINDICKYASHLDGKAYVVFPTAASMNGYLSANASITAAGHKKTFAAHLPIGVFCDVGVIASAPIRLTKSGLGDSLARSTAQADWLLSHLLLGTDYLPLPFELLKPYEEKLFAAASKLGAGDFQAIELLIKTLLISGLGMVIAGGSYPASQGEHLIAHTMEMKHGGALPATYHGEQIGVTTLTMAAIQQAFLAQMMQLPEPLNWSKNIENYFGMHLSDSVFEASKKKRLLYANPDALNARLAEKDISIRKAIAEVIVPEVKLRAALTAAGAFTTPAELGWKMEDFELAVIHARLIRDRFTFLDLL